MTRVGSQRHRKNNYTPLKTVNVIFDSSFLTLKRIQNHDFGNETWTEEQPRLLYYDFITIYFTQKNVRTQNLTLEKKVTEQAVLDRRQRCVKCQFNRTMEFASGHQDRLPSCDVFYKWK